LHIKEIHSLRNVTIANNRISLLQRNINQLSYLSKLDLSCNILRALPIEFADLLESVPDVIIGSNPWTDFPPIWNRNWSTISSQSDCPNGYSVSDAIDFMYNVRIFYDAAEKIWMELGAFYYSNRLGLKDFVLELQKRLPNSWHSGLEDLVEYVYFKVYLFHLYYMPFIIIMIIFIFYNINNTMKND